MNRTPSRNVSVFMFLAVLVLLIIGLSPNGATLAAVNTDFAGFVAGTTADSITTITGIASMVSNPANSTTIQDSATEGVGAPFAGNALFNIGLSGTLTITFDQPQDSYSMSYETNGGPGNFIVEGFRTGVAGAVFTDTTPVPGALTAGTATGNLAIFDQLVVSSTTTDWGMDNLITTDAAPGVSIIQSGGSTDVSEAGATIDTYDIALDAPPTTDNVTINLVPDANCIVSVPSVTFVIGDFVPQTILVQAVDDQIAENDPHLCVITQTITTTDSAYNGMLVPEVDVNVTDDDFAGVTVTPTTVNVAEGGATDSYTVVLDTEPTGTVTINVSGDSQCQVEGAASVPLTFNPASAPLWSDPQTITVSAIDDSAVEGAHTCTISHSASSAGDAFYTGALLIADVTGNITDNDTASVDISALTPATVDETGPTTADYDISLASDPAFPVTINLAIDPSTAGQCTLSTNLLTFNPSGGLPSPQTITVTAVDDLIPEASPHDCIINHTATSLDGNYDAIPIASLTVPVMDNDVPDFNFVPAAVNVTEGSVLSDTYTISLATIPLADVTISIVPDTQCTVSVPSVTIVAPATTSASISVLAVDDAVVESPVHPCVVTHTVTASGADYTGLSKNLFVSVTDNDIPPSPIYNSIPAPAPAAASNITLTTTQGSNINTTITVSNIGTAALNVSSVALTGNAELTLTTPTSFTIPVGVTTADITVQCDATTTGTFITDVSVTHDGTAPSVSPATYTVTCDVTAPIYSSIPAQAPAAASDIVINTTQGNNLSTTITVSNTGTAAMNVSSVALTGDAELTLTTPASFAVGVGLSAPITIQCDATTVGTFNTAVSVTHDAVGSPAAYTVTCNVSAVAAPIYSSIPAQAPAAASDIVINTTQGNNQTTTITVSNTGTAAMNVSSVALTGGAELTLTTPASFAVGVGLSAPITIQCDATTVGTFNTAVSVTHDAVGSPAAYTVTCNVTAAAAPIYSSIPAQAPAAASDIVINTTQGSNQSTTITVSNNGSAALNVALVGLTGDAQLTLTTPASFSIPVGVTTADIIIQCDATTVGTFNTAVSVTHDAVGSPAAYTVTCNVTAAAAPIYSSIPAQAPAAASDIVINTTQGSNQSTTITVSNNGSAVLNVALVGLTGDAQLTLTTPASFSIPVGVTTADIIIQCDATTVGTFNTAVSVTHDAVGSPAAYTVTCNVTAVTGNPGYNSNPPPGTLNITTPINTPLSAVITVNENGDSTLTVSSMTVLGDPELTLLPPTSFVITDGGAAHQVSVQCLSATAGTFATDLTVIHNGTTAIASPAVYTINCTVTAASGPVYTSSPAPLQPFTIQPTGVGQGANGIVHVTNTGIGTLDILGVTLINDLSLGHLTTGLPPNQHLTAGQSTDISVQCDANFNGSVTATLSVTHNGSGASSPATYPVTCTISPVGPRYSSFPPPGSIIDVGTVLIGSQTGTNLIVSEVGGAALSVVPLASGSITGPNASEFAILSGGPPFTIPDGGASQTISIGCVPQAQGLRLATLTFFTNDPLLPSVSYLLACVGSNVAVVTATPQGFVPTAVPPTATIIIPATAQVTEVKGLAVRTGPYLGATLINVARPGTTYSILAQNHDEGPYTWYLIKIGRETGWVSGRYLIVTGTIDAVPYSGSIFDQIDNPPDVGVRLTTNAIIDMRRRPSPRTSRVGTIPAGTEVIVLGRTVQERQTFWIQVSYNGIVGWVPALPVTMRGAVETLPVR